MNPSPPPPSISAAAPFASYAQNFPPRASAISPRSSPKIFSRASRNPLAPTSISARSTAALRTIKWKRYSKLSLAPCASPSPATNASAAFSPAPKACYERHPPRLRRRQRHQRRTRPPSPRRNFATRQHARTARHRASHNSPRRRPLLRANPRPRRAPTPRSPRRRHPPRRALPRHLPRPASSLQIQRRSSATPWLESAPRPRLFPSRHRETPAHGLESTRSHARVATSRKHFARSILLLRAFLCRHGSEWRVCRALQLRYELRRRHRAQKHFRRAISSRKKRRPRRPTPPKFPNKLPLMRKPLTQATPKTLSFRAKRGTCFFFRFKGARIA